MSGTTPRNDEWPDSSSESLPPLPEFLSERLENGKELEFPINEECTSLAIVPSGRHVVAGFTDGTVRLFDLTNKFQNRAMFSDDSFDGDVSSKSSCEPLFDSDSSSDEEEDENLSPSKSAKSRLVCSKSHQRYGTVACQIHAKGVHTSLQMTVAVSPDGLYAFGGVARGSMEMVAVRLANLENYLDLDCTNGLHILDLLEVQRHADAKLRGFGACTRLQSDSTKDTTYLLLTGKGIKNIHIWSFVPAREEWTCLYDTQTNGNSISLLQFRYTPEDRFLQALSKSDQQKVRIWDLSYEQHQGNKQSKYYKQVSKKVNPTSRAKRPTYIDLPLTESTLGIGGDFLFGGSHQQVSLVNLNMAAPYNRTEIGMPGCHTRRGGRQQRGELKSLTQVAGMTMGSSHAIFELSDGSIMHYANGAMRQNAIKVPPKTGDGDCNSSTLCVARIGCSGIAVTALATTSKIVIHQIGAASAEGYWGFHGIRHSRKSFAGIAITTEATLNVKSLSCHDTSPVVNKLANITTSSSEKNNNRYEESPPSILTTFTNAINKKKKLAITASHFARSAKVSPENIKKRPYSSTSRNPPNKTTQAVVSALSPEPILSVNGERSAETADKNQTVSAVSRPSDLSFAPSARNAKGEEGNMLANLVSPVRAVTLLQNSKPSVPSSTQMKTNLKHNPTIKSKKSTRKDKDKVVSTRVTSTKEMTHVAPIIYTKTTLKKAKRMKVNNSSDMSTLHGTSVAPAMDTRLPTLSYNAKPRTTGNLISRAAKNKAKAESPLSTTKIKEFSKSRTVSPASEELHRKRGKDKKRKVDKQSNVTTKSQPQKNNLVLHLRIPRNPKLSSDADQNKGESDHTEKGTSSGSALKSKIISVPILDSPEISAKGLHLEKKGKKRNLTAASSTKTLDTDRYERTVCNQTADLAQNIHTKVALSDCRRKNLGISVHSLVLRRRPKKQRIDFPSETPKREQMRIKLAMEHRAVHESLRNQVLESVAQLIRCAKSDSRSTEEIKGAFENSTDLYRDMLKELLFRQELEAETLAATLCLPITPIISFPFPEVFDQSRTILEVYLESRKV